MYCVNCGAEIGNANFCQECGKKQVEDVNSINDGEILDSKKSKNNKGLLSVLSFVIFLLIFSSKNMYLTIFLMAASFVLSILALVKKSTYKALAVIAIVLNSLLGIIILLYFMGMNYEATYNNYAEKIRSETPAMISEIRTQIASDPYNYTEAANIVTKNVERLAEIENEGVKQLAIINRFRSNTYSEYLNWSEKLYSVYLEEAKKLYAEYAVQYQRQYGQAISDFSNYINSIGNMFR